MSKYRRLIRDIAGSVDYWAQAAMRHFVLEIDSRMKARGISRAMLAQKLETTPAYVSKVMRGDVNFTLETMTKLAMAVDGKLQVRVIDQSEPMALSRPLELGKASRSAWLVAKDVPMKAEVTQSRVVRAGITAHAARYDYEKVGGRAA